MLFGVNTILQTANNSIAPVDVLKANISHPGLKIIAHINFGEHDFAKDLDPGVPADYKYDPAEPEGFSSVDLAQAAKYLRSFIGFVGKPEMKKKLFVQLGENLHHNEFLVLTFAKDKALHELYPQLTREVFVSAGLL